MAANLALPLASRLLELERRQARMDDALRALNRQETAIRQGLWQHQMDLGGLPQTAPAPAPPECIEDFTHLCPCMPTTITLTDNYYGPVSLAYNPTHLAWEGCAIRDRPGDASCATPVTFALHYTLNGGSSRQWSLVTQYRITNFTTRCPVPSVCTDVVTQSLNLLMTIRPAQTSSVSFGVTGANPGSQAWPGPRTVILSIPALCPQGTILCGATNVPVPAAIPLSDPYFGISKSLVYESSSDTWKLCTAAIDPAHPGISGAIHYTLSRTGGGTLTVDWRGDATCLLAPADCATPPDCTGTFAGGSCNATFWSKQFSVGPASAAAIKALYNAGAATRTVTLGPV